VIQRLASPALLWTRRLVAPALLVALCGAMFGRAFDPVDLVIATVVSIVLGGCVGWLAAMREHLMSGAASVVVPVAALIVAAVVGVSVVGETWFRPDTMADAMTTFLLVGLPAPGLDSLSIVVFVVLFPTMVATTWASARKRTLATITPPTLAVGVIGLLVAPVGSAWWVPVLVAAVCGAVLMVDVRNDLASIPPLVGSGTELRRQLTWWRPVVQVVPALVAVVVFGAVVPTASTFDLRQFVHPSSIRVEDPSPLAVAARWRDLESSEPSARVTVDGAAPGRIRVAVLDDYDQTGWEQAADYGVTGDSFAADPIYPDGPVRNARSVLTVERGEEAGFRAMPTAGVPERTDDPADIRYSPEAGTIYAADGGRRVQYTAAPTATAPPVADEPLVSEFPAELATCPPSEPLQSVASQLTAGLVSASGRLGRIEDWLLTRRIYDPKAPGGQTLGSVEQFLSQPYARGNLEVFVTTYALLARCAGIPVRVVVGYPAPMPGTTDYSQRDITAWVETPLALTGWAPFDPVPTPAEQERLAQLAQQPTPDPAKPPAVDGAPPQQVATSNLPGSGFPWWWVIVAAVVLAIVAAWTFLLPLMVRSRRQKTADPADAVLAAWSTVCDELTDRNVGLASNLTPGEVVSVCSASMPISVPGLVSGIAPMVDRVRYSGVPGTPEDAGAAWGHVEALDERLPSTWSTRLTALRHPIRQIRRLASTVGVARQAGRWRAELPDTAVISSAEAPSDIPDVGIDARIGDGSTGTVYRGVFVPTGEAVAVKVFRYGPNDPGFDGNRFDWEVRIAREVSGLPNLPVIFDAGITPTSGRPYMVSSLYRQGTLLDHVRRGGLMTTAEAVAIGGDLAVALEALHQLGVIHADVKPENVFASDGGWVLGDLGSAWLRTARGPAASLTPPYAAPEVWRGGSPTPEADIYSLGLTMLFARTGLVPIAGNPPSPDDVVAAFPDLPIVLRALDPDPRRRPRSVADLGRALRPGFFTGVAGGRVLTLSLPTPTVTHSRD